MQVNISQRFALLFAFSLMTSWGIATAEDSPRPGGDSATSQSAWSEADWWSFYYTTEAMVSYGATAESIYNYATQTMEHIGSFDPHYAPTPDIWPAPPSEGGPGAPGNEIEVWESNPGSRGNGGSNTPMTPQPPFPPGCGAPYCPPISDVTPPRELAYAFTGLGAAAAGTNTPAGAAAGAICQIIAILIHMDNDEKEEEEDDNEGE